MYRWVQMYIDGVQMYRCGFRCIGEQMYRWGTDV